MLVEVLLSDHLLFYLCFLSNGAVVFVHLDCDLTVLHSLNDIKALYHTPVNRCKCLYASVSKSFFDMR